MINAQEWLDENYPKETRKDITELDIRYKGLEWHLDLNDFTNALYITVAHNNLASTQLEKCAKLRHFVGAVNSWTNFSLSDLGKYTNLEQLWMGGATITGSLISLRDMKNLRILAIDGTNIDDGGLEYLPESLVRIYCDGWFAEQLKDYIQEDGTGDVCYDFQSWRKNQLYSYLINKTETKDQTINYLQTQLTSDQTIISNLQSELNETIYQLNNTNAQLNSWQTPIFWPQLTLGQPNSVVTFRAPTNVLGTTALCLLAHHLYRKYKLRPIQSLLAEEVTNLKQQINQVTKIISPQEELNFATLQQEITRLKTQDLTPRLRTKQNQLNEISNGAKNQLSSDLKPIFDLYLVACQQEESDLNQGQIQAYQATLQTKLSTKIIQQIKQLQREVIQLEQQLANLRLVNNNRQVAQIIQPLSH